MGNPAFRAAFLLCLCFPPLFAQSTTYTLELEAWRSDSALEYRPEAVTAAAESADSRLHRPGVPEYREHLVALKAALGMSNQTWFARVDFSQTPTYTEPIQTLSETLQTDRIFELQRRDMGLIVGYKWRNFGFFTGYQHTEFTERIAERDYLFLSGETSFDAALPGRSEATWTYRGGRLGLDHHEKLENAPLTVYAALSGVWLQGDARFDTVLLDVSDPAAPSRTRGNDTRLDTELSGVTLEAALLWQLNPRWSLKIGYRHQDWDERDNLVLPQVRNGDGLLALRVHF